MYNLCDTRVNFLRLQICEDSAEVATSESKESSGSMSNVQEADSRVVSHRFKPRSVLKTAPGLFGSTEKVIVITYCLYNSL